MEAVDELAFLINLSRLRNMATGVIQARVHIDIKKGTDDGCGQGQACLLADNAKWRQAMQGCAGR